MTLGAQSAGVSASSDPHLRTAVRNYLLQEKDDEVVLAFGPDYFHGARMGAGVGGLTTGLWSHIIYRRMREDQRQANLEVGLKPGQRNKNFSRWVLVRGLRTQPMLTVGCYGLLATTLFKSIKLSLAHRRCQEFFLDDVEFAMLAHSSKDDPVTRELLEKICREASANGDGVPVSLAPKAAASAPPSSAATGYRSAEQVLRESSVFASPDINSGTATRRSPTYWDGVAVGVLGSIMDCYVPMKPLQRYYNMRFGML